MAYFNAVALWCLFLLSHSASGAYAQNNYLDQAINASQTLINTYYNSTTGLFNAKWWNTAAILASLSGLQTLQAGATNPDVPTLLSTVFGLDRPDFTEMYEFYDDEGWWAINWIAGYDLTGNADYLSEAQTIFSDMTGGWEQNCGGIWWNKAHAQENAITNVLFLDMCAQLAIRDPNNATYSQWAQKQWDWFSNSGLLNASANAGTVLGSYNYSTCQASGDGLTYVQGVAIDALLALAKADPATPEYLGNATAIADASITWSRYLDANGILTEPVGSFDEDRAERKGIFMYYLSVLQATAPKQSYIDFATNNADSIWSSAMGTDGLFGPLWDSDADAANVASHSSAMMALLAAAKMQAGAASTTSTGSAATSTSSVAVASTTASITTTTAAMSTSTLSASASSASSSSTDEAGEDDCGVPESDD